MVVLMELGTPGEICPGCKLIMKVLFGLSSSLSSYPNVTMRVCYWDLENIVHS